MKTAAKPKAKHRHGSTVSVAVISLLFFIMTVAFSIYQRIYTIVRSLFCKSN